MYTESKTVLVVCMTDLPTDPRVVREIDWLTAAGWTVDSLGLGDSPRPSVRTHFAMTEVPGWTKPRPILGVILAAFPWRLRFRTLFESRIPKAATRRVRASAYDLVLMNDIDLLPWVAAHAPSNGATRVHADLHEYFPDELPEGTALKPLLTGFYRWQRSFIRHRAITSRSVVASGIADRYQTEFGIERPHIVRNTPPFVDQRPSPIDADRVRLVFHGHAAWGRGLREMFDAMALLDDRFDLTLMLTGNAETRREVAEAIEQQSARISIVDPVPMRDVAARINEFDLEVMFFPPRTANLLYALPNKLFEAVQGRLGLVIGPSPSMEAIIAEFGNGVVTEGWTAEDLADALRPLTGADVTRLKERSDAAADVLSAEAEQEVFTCAIGEHPAP
ncbi:glycosyltransferase [Agromyces sp. NPDC055520]